AATDGAGDVQRGGPRGAAGENETLERLELRVGRVDPALHLRDAIGRERRRLWAAPTSRWRWGREGGTERQEGRLEGAGPLAPRARRRLGDGPPHDRVELVDLAVRADAGVILRHATAAEERRFPGVTGPRVNLHFSPRQRSVRALLCRPAKVRGPSIAGQG